MCWIALSVNDMCRTSFADVSLRQRNSAPHPDTGVGRAVRRFLAGSGWRGDRAAPSDPGDGPLVVGAAVRRPQDRRRAGRGAACPVQSRTAAAVDDLVPAVADAGQAPLLVVA